jgi:hypothetical protein
VRRRLAVRILRTVQSEKKEVCGQPTVEARARARDGCRSRWGALAEQGEAGSGLGRRPLPCLVRIGRYCPCVGKLNSKQASEPTGFFLGRPPGTSVDLPHHRSTRQSALKWPASTQEAADQSDWMRSTGTHVSEVDSHMLWRSANSTAEEEMSLALHCLSFFARNL